MEQKDDEETKESKELQKYFYKGQHNIKSELTIANLIQFLPSTVTFDFDDDILDIP